MTVSLEQQVRDYASHVVELSTPVDIDALTRQVLDDPTPISPPRRPRARWAVALASALVLLTLIGGVALGLRLLISDAPPVITQPSPDTSVPTPTSSLPGPPTTVATRTTVVDVGGAAPMTWEQLPPQASLGAGDESYQYFMHSIVNGGPGLIAAGRAWNTSGLRFDWPSDNDEAALWVSEDGISWERLSTQGPGFDGPNGYAIHDLAVGGPGYVAVGWLVEDGWERPAVWVSSDLAAWTRVESDSFDDLGTMEAVAVGEEGIVAVGSGGIWFSPDGREWQRAVQSSSSPLSDVAATEWGFIAVGVVEEPMDRIDGLPVAEAFRPYVAISNDGSTWEKIDLPEEDDWFGAQASAIAAVDGQIVVGGIYRNAWGTYFDMPPAFWSSEDGTSWDVYGVEAAPVKGMSKPSASIRSLAITESGIVAVGGWLHIAKSPAETNRVRVAVWASRPDGTWVEIPPGDIFEVEDVDGAFATTGGIEEVVVLDGLLVGVGTESGLGTVWIGEWTD